MDQHITVDHSNIFWHKEVPLKVNIFALCLWSNRLPTTNNLIKRKGAPIKCYVMCMKLWQGGGYLPSPFVLRFIWKNLVWYICLVRFYYGSSNSSFQSFTLIRLDWWLFKDSLPCSSFNLAFCIWTIWHKRNSRVFNTQGGISSASSWESKTTIFGG